MRIVVFLVLTAQALVACGDDAAVAVPTHSGFDTGDDGWSIVGDAQAKTAKPDYQGTGGNPDGLISARDDVAGGVWYFQAPAKYLGDHSGNVGKVLRYDLKITKITEPFSAPDVVLVGAGTTIVYDTSPDPGEDWTSYAVPLTSAGWKFDNLAGAAVDDATFDRVLGELTVLRIRGEFNTGPDTGALDNVHFGAD